MAERIKLLLLREKNPRRWIKEAISFTILMMAKTRMKMTAMLVVVLLSIAKICQRTALQGLIRLRKEAIIGKSVKVEIINGERKLSKLL